MASTNLFHHARATSRAARMSWVMAAGIAAGSGIWATHFIAMLAYDPGIGIAYDLELTVLSLVAAAAITSLGLAVAVYGPPPWGPAIGGGIVGAGGGGRHFTRMDGGGRGAGPHQLGSAAGGGFHRARNAVGNCAPDDCGAPRRPAIEPHRRGS